MIRAVRQTLIGLVGIHLLILWLVVAAVWVRSYWRGDVIIIHRNDLDEPPLPLQPRFHARTWVALSGRGGVALAVRQASRMPMLQDRNTADQTSWTVHPNPGYPQPSSPLAVTGQIMITSRPMQAARPSTQAGIASVSIATAGGSFTVSAPPGSQLNVTPSAGGVQAVTPRIVGGITLSGGTLVLNAVGPPTGPTTMGSALASASIAPPPNPPPGSRLFYVYTAGAAVSPVNDLGDLSRVVIFPWWAVQAAVTLPVLGVILRLRTSLRLRRRKKTGCCVRCGYDLRATPQRCPECGLESGSPVGAAGR